MELGALPSEPVQPPEPAASDQEATRDPTGAFSLDKKALWSLAGQHLVSGSLLDTSLSSDRLVQSSSWGSRSWEFASFLFLVELFPNRCVGTTLHNEERDLTLCICLGAASCPLRSSVSPRPALPSFSRVSSAILWTRPRG